jgi:hypothetical protein
VETKASEYTYKTTRTKIGMEIPPKSQLATYQTVGISINARHLLDTDINKVARRNSHACVVAIVIYLKENLRNTT